MHSDRASIMLVGPGRGGPIPLVRKHRRFSRLKLRQSSPVNYQQVRHSLSMAKADKRDWIATEIKNPATHCFDRSDAWRDVAQGRLAFRDPLLDRSDFKTLHFERRLKFYKAHHFLLVVADRSGALAPATRDVDQLRDDEQDCDACR